MGQDRDGRNRVPNRARNGRPGGRRNTCAGRSAPRFR